MGGKVWWAVEPLFVPEICWQQHSCSPQLLFRLLHTAASLKKAFSFVIWIVILRFRSQGGGMGPLEWFEWWELVKYIHYTVYYTNSQLRSIWNADHPSKLLSIKNHATSLSPASYGQDANQGQLSGLRPLFLHSSSCGCRVQASSSCHENFFISYSSLVYLNIMLHLYSSAVTPSVDALSSCLPWSRIHERTISLSFLGIILRVLSLEVSIYTMFT